jgi:hypothetical protein
MRQDFKISLTGEAPLGDYLPFLISDGVEERQGRITLTALAVLGSSSGGDDVGTFNANLSKIRSAVARKLSAAPRDEAIMVRDGDLN